MLPPLPLIVVRSGMFSWLLSSLVFWFLLQLVLAEQAIRVMAMVRPFCSVDGD